MLGRRRRALGGGGVLVGELAKVLEGVKLTLADECFWLTELTGDGGTRLAVEDAEDEDVALVVGQAQQGAAGECCGDAGGRVGRRGAAALGLSAGNID